MFTFVQKSLSRLSMLAIAAPIAISCAFSVQAQVPFSIDENTTSETQEVNQLTLERMHSSPSLNGANFKKIKYASDGQSVFYLKSKVTDKNRYDLWQFDIATSAHKLLIDADVVFSGKEELSDEEKARRERMRVSGSGFINYAVANNGKHIAFSIGGDVYVYNIETTKSRRLTLDQAFETDIKFSPKGRYVSFIKEQDLHIVDIESNTQTQLTSDGEGTIKNGMAEFVAQEEMDRMTGYWWSPDERYIAFLKVDESNVQTAVRNEIYAQEIKLFNQRYPATGTNNVNVSLHTVKVNTGKISELKLGDDKDIYIARVNWLPDSKSLSYQWQNRNQQELRLNFHNLKARKPKTILTETSEHWINLNDDLTFLKGRKQFIWASEKDGFKHLYLYNYKGEQLAQLTKGDWVVDEIVGLDEENGWVYFTGRADTPIEKHLYKVTLDGKSPEHVTRITKRSGYHQITFAADNQSYINNFSNIDTPSQLSLHKQNGNRISYLLENRLDETHPIFAYKEQLVTPKFGSIKANDGTTDLYYKYYQPKQLTPGKKYPVIINVYGGPHAQRVINKWTGADINQYFVSQGYIVVQLDNRGSNYRGTKFEFAIDKQLGVVELEDQITGVERLKTLSYVDSERIGIYGHSYGGYMALMAMFKAGDVFKAGVSGAPVTDWMLYDTHYTERYLDLPKVNESGYEQSSVFPFIKDFNNDNGLYVYHGMADDNVLFTHTTKLIKAMQDQNKQFDLMTYPGSKHSMRGKDVRVHLHSSIVRFFDRYLK